VADSNDTLAARYVKHIRKAELRAVTAADEQQFPVAAEAHTIRIAIREGFDAEQFARVAVIHQHLMLSADGDKRGPRPRVQRGNRSQSLRAHDGLEQPIHWHRSRTFG